jgi:hypothetical protein
VTKLISIVLVLATAGTAWAATQSYSTATRQLRAPLQIGSVVPELLDPSLQDLTIGLMKQANLADVGRITVTWQKGQTAMDPGQLGDLRTGVDNATAAGVDVYLDIYPNGSSQTPNSPARPGRLRHLGGIDRRGPAEREARDRRQRVQPHLFWLPQFGSAGQDLAATGYTKLLAKTYERDQGGAPAVEVLGGALAHSGTDKPLERAADTLAGAVHPRHGHGVRALKRTKPIMDAFAYHPTWKQPTLPPTCRHVRGKTLTIDRLRKLVSALNRAFEGTKQKGAALRSSTTNSASRRWCRPRRAARTAARSRGPRTRARGDAGRYYEQGFPPRRLPATVRRDMVFRLIDSEFLESFQSGVYYADRTTPKSSLPAVAAAATKYRSRTITGCATLLAPTPVISWPTRTLACDADCAYVETFRRVGSSAPVATIRGTALAGVDTRLAQAKLKPGRYRITLRVTATAYRANAFTATSPPFG